MKILRIRSLLALAITAFIGNTYAAELEEIIVTAQKRAESLQDVPISMSAIDGSKIEEIGQMQTMVVLGEIKSFSSFPIYAEK